MYIQIAFTDLSKYFDLALSGADLTADDGLETAVIISLFSDRRADDDDAIPDGSNDRRGWWGDTYADIEGDKIGSILWLLSRSKQVPDVARQAKGHIEEALSWMIEDGVTQSVSVVCEWYATGILAAAITLVRPNGTPLTMKFANLWEAVNAL